MLPLQVLAEQLSMWRVWSTVHLGKRDKGEAADRFWRLATRRRAWDGWRGYCTFAERANRVRTQAATRLGRLFGVSDLPCHH